MTAKFVKAWNDADFPTGPSQILESLQGMENSFAEIKGRLEVTPTLLASYVLMIILVHHPQSPRFGSNCWHFLE